MNHLRPFNGLMLATAFAGLAFAAPVAAQESDDANAEDMTEIEQAVANATEEDIDNGRQVYADTGECRNCHGWNGAGLGKADHYPTGANLRESQLGANSLAEIIQCGIPGTEMPFHDQVAYRDDRCYGMTFSDFEGTTPPDRGAAIRSADREDLVAYLLEYVIGAGETTLEDCARYFGSEDNENCDQFRDS